MVGTLKIVNLIDVVFMYPKCTRKIGGSDGIVVTVTRNLSTTPLRHLTGDTRGNTASCIICFLNPRKNSLTDSLDA